MLTAATSVSAVTVIFLQLIRFASTAAFFCSLLGIAHTLFEKATPERKLAREGIVEEINRSRDSWKRWPTKPAFHAHSAILDSFFYAYSAIVDNFMTVSLFLEKHCIPQY